MTEAPAEPPVRLGPAAANVARSIWHQKELLVLGLVLGLALGWFGLPKVLSSGSTYDATVRLQVLQPPADAILKVPPAVGQAPSDDSSGASPDVLKDVVVADRVVEYLRKTKRLGAENDLSLTQIRVLGAFGSEGPGQRPSAFLVNDRTLVDGGSVSGGLSLPEQFAIDTVLLTHLHMDHIQGLMFFAPAFNPTAEMEIWGPEAPDASLRDRIARYISAPLSPVEVRELPCHVSFNEAPHSEWRIGSATIRAASVTHRGPTLGYRITEAGAEDEPC